MDRFAIVDMIENRLLAMPTTMLDELFSSPKRRDVCVWTRLG